MTFHVKLLCIVLLILSCLTPSTCLLTRPLYRSSTRSSLFLKPKGALDYVKTRRLFRNRQRGEDALLVNQTLIVNGSNATLSNASIPIKLPTLPKKIKATVDVNAVDLLRKRKASETVTVQELLDVIQTLQTTTASNSRRPTPLDPRSGVAFPQASVVTYQQLRQGTTTTAGILGMILLASIRPNLWLVGAFAGAAYGRNRISLDEDETEWLPRTIQRAGRQVTEVAVEIMDRLKALYFLYKTGELSYDYYKRYQKIDERWKVQEKMDAWNARFVAGKEKFDAWEQKNEIGRKVLATVRTAWLVDEQQRRKRKGSPYRVVRWYQTGRVWLMRKLEALRKGIMGEGWQDLSPDSASSRWGAALGAAVLFNVIGLFFSASPVLLTTIAFGIGLVRPDRCVNALRTFLNPPEKEVTNDDGKPTKDGRSTKNVKTKKGTKKSDGPTPQTWSMEFRSPFVMKEPVKKSRKASVTMAKKKKSKEKEPFIKINWPKLKSPWSAEEEEKRRPWYN